MKVRTLKVLALSLGMVMVAAVSFAQTELVPSSGKGQPAGTSCRAAEQVSIGEAAFVAAKREKPVQSKIYCLATATCWDSSEVTCSASGTSCSATDSNCPSTQGSVTCNGTTTWCPACPPDCSVYNHPGCTYSLGPSGCCIPSNPGPGCLGICFDP